MDQTQGDPPIHKYTAMEFLPRSLGDLIKASSKLEVSYAVKVTIEICKALDYLHSNSLIHNDIKPDHIMLGDNGEIKLSNLLLVKQMSDSLVRSERRPTMQPMLSEAPLLDLDGISIPANVNYDVSGTPEYMAPEIWKGDPIDGRADIYSLGIVLHQMITGVLPFSGDNMELFLQHQRSDIPDISSIGGVTDGLVSIIQQAMAKDATERFRTTLDFAETLQEL